MRVIVTGGAGFIGGNFIRYMLKKYNKYEFINLDKLTYAGNLKSIEDLLKYPNYKFVQGDIADKQVLQDLMPGVDAIINFAAESHVDRSIDGPEVFVLTNVLGTQVLLEAARKHKVSKFVQISTDEVYGSLGADGLFTELTPIAPSSPYSASKASADLLVYSYYHTYGMDVSITRCSNNYGPYQHLEKLIPSFITKAIKDRPLPIYGDGLNIRDWLYVDDHCSAIDLVLHSGQPGEVYNIGGNNEHANLEITKIILSALGKSEDLIEYVTDRPGHDRRYAIDSTKIRTQLGWNPQYNFEEGIQETIEWYKNNTNWVEGGGK